MSAFIRGTCASMCPEKERFMREKEGLLHRFEIDERTKGTKRPKADPTKTVKAYSRSAAGQTMTDPDQLRPGPVLLFTIKYLFAEIATRTDGDWLTVYDFVFDRLRAVRQDVVIQRIEARIRIQIYEPIVRFLVYAAQRLCERDISDFDVKINNQHLLECIKTLLLVYDELEKTDVDPGLELYVEKITLSDSRPQMEAIYILLNIGDTDALNRALNLSRDLRESPEVRLATKISFAWYSKNYVRVCSLILKLPPILVCAAMINFQAVRRTAMKIMSAGYNSKALTFPGVKLQGILLYRDVEKMREDCEALGQRFVDQNVLFQKACFEDDVKLVNEADERAELKDEIPHGSMNVVKRQTDSLPFNSFDLKSIRCGAFKNNQFFVSRIIGCHRCGSSSQGCVLFEMIPLHAVSREHGIFVKKHLQNYNNVHCLLVPSKTAERIKEEWRKKSESSHLLVSFVKTLIHKVSLLHKGRSYETIVMLPGDAVAFSVTSDDVYFKKPQNIYAQSKVGVPPAVIELLKCSDAINLNEPRWKTSSVLDTSTQKQTKESKEPPADLPKAKSNEPERKSCKTSRRIPECVTSTENIKIVQTDKRREATKILKEASNSETKETSETAEKFEKENRITNDETSNILRLKGNIERSPEKETSPTKRHKRTENSFILTGRKRPYEIYPRGHSSLDLTVEPSNSSLKVHNELLEPSLRAKAYGRKISLILNREVRRDEGSTLIQEHSRFTRDERFASYSQQKCQSNRCF